MARPKKLQRFMRLRKIRLRLNFSNQDSNYRLDLSDFEEKNDSSFLIDIGRKAAVNAVNENLALKIPVTYLEGDWVVRRMPEGNVERIVRIEAPAGVLKRRKLTKGTVLHVKKAN